MSFIALAATAGATALGASVTTAAVVGAGAGMVASKGLAGYQASKIDNSGALSGASEMSMAERAQMGQENDLKLKKINAKSESMMDMATASGQKSMMGVYKAKEGEARSGFAGNEMSDASIGQVKSNVYKDYNRKVDSILEDDEMQKQSVSLSTQRQSADIEKRFQSNISQAQANPDTFWEGFTGQSDYQTK